jgi:zinc D-Ala-D-Ala carboxypeptidase
MILSKNFTLQEFTKSVTAIRNDIDNSPNAEHIRNIQLLVKYVLQPLREGLNKPIRITSGYRSEALNKAIKGSKKSQHCKGQAADLQFKVDGVMNNKAIWDKVIELDLPFDQMINEFEFSWIHISYNHEHNRKSLLEAYKENGRTKYKYHTIERGL